MAAPNATTSTGAVIIVQVSIDGIPGIAVKTGSGQIAEVIGPQQGYIVAHGTVQVAVDHMIAMFP